MMALHCSPEPSGLCGITLKSKDLNHNHLVTSIGSSMIWPSDLLFDQFSNTYEISSRQTFWPSFMSIRLKIWSLERTQGFSKMWPSDLVFDPTWTNFELVWVSSKEKFWPSFKIIGLKMWPLKRTQDFYKIWPSDLVFDPKWPIFKSVRDFILANILISFFDYQTENAFRAYKRFF